MKILSLQEDRSHAEIIQSTLSDMGHNVLPFQRGREAIRHLEGATVDLVVLDWHTPNLSGRDVLGWIRTRIGTRLPVLMLTCFEQENEVAEALNTWADDFMFKPLRRVELSARVDALLRRAYPEALRNVNCIQLGAYVLDICQRTITLNGRTLILTPREFELASLLFRRAGQIVPRGDLNRFIWGRDEHVQSRSLDTHVCQLRKKLELNPKHGATLRSVYQRGYCLREAA